MYEFSPYVKDSYPFFQKLAKTRTEGGKRTLLEHATADQILALVEICANILHSNFLLNRRQKERLARYADFYRTLSRARSVRSARQRIRNQEGGGLALGAILIPVLSVLAQHLLEKVL